MLLQHRLEHARIRRANELLEPLVENLDAARVQRGRLLELLDVLAADLVGARRRALGEAPHGRVELARHLLEHGELVLRE